MKLRELLMIATGIVSVTYWDGDMPEDYELVCDYDSASGAIPDAYLDYCVSDIWAMQSYNGNTAAIRVTIQEGEVK